LITRSQDGKYGLSSIGVAAAKLMSGVEEHPAVPTHKKARDGLDVLKFYPLILVGILVFAGLYFASFTTIVTSEDVETTPGTLFSIRTGETFQYNVTIVFSEGMREQRVEDDALYEVRAPLIDTLTLWEKGLFSFGLEGNGTFDMQITVYTPAEANKFDGMSIVITNATQINATQISVYRPTRTATYRERFDNFQGRILGLGHTEITQEGTYTCEIRNLGTQEITGLLSVHLGWELFHRPYFIFGVAAISLALIYPVLLLLKLAKEPKILA
jgi:hypothetical protein